MLFLASMMRNKIIINKRKKGGKEGMEKEGSKKNKNAILKGEVYTKKNRKKVNE